MGTTMGDEVQVDKAAAAAFQAEHEAAIKAKQDHADTLTGKDNKKARTEASKEISAMKNDDKYIDTLKIAKDLPPPHGNFVIGGGQKKEEAKKVDVEAAAAAAGAEAEEAQESFGRRHQPSRTCRVRRFEAKDHRQKGGVG